FAFSNLTKDTAHDLAGSGLWKIRYKLNDIRFSYSTDQSCHRKENILLCLLGVDMVVGDNVGIDTLSFDRMRIAYDCRLDYIGVHIDRVFHFGRTDAVS